MILPATLMSPFAVLLFSDSYPTTPNKFDKS
jgi:hypothetical protein